MSRWILTLAVAMAMNLVVGGCTPAAPAPAAAPTAGAAGAATPVKAAAPTQVGAKAVAPTQMTPIPVTPSQVAAKPATKVDFPTKPITILIGQAAGGANDTQARIVAEGLSEIFGVPVNVQNVAGASGAVMLTEFSRAKPDGYTLAGLMPTLMVTYLLDPKSVTYNRESIVQVANVVSDLSAFIVRYDSPYQNIRQMIDASKSGTRITTGFTGIYAPSWFAIRILENLPGAEGSKFADVNFDSGAEVLTAVLGGKIDFGLRSLGPTLPLYKSREVRIIAQTGKERSPVFPDVPTLIEEGYPLYWSQDRGYAVPKGTPREIIDVLAGALKELVKGEGASAKKFRERMEKAGMDTTYEGPEEYAANWDATERDLTRVSAELGLIKK